MTNDQMDNAQYWVLTIVGKGQKFNHLALADGFENAVSAGNEIADAYQQENKSEFHVSVLEPITKNQYRVATEPKSKTIKFEQWDGKENKAKISARKTKHGWNTVIKIGNIQQTFQTQFQYHFDCIEFGENNILYNREQILD